MELRLVLLWVLEEGVLISPHSLVVVFVFVAAAAVLSCLQTFMLSFQVLYLLLEGNLHRLYYCRIFSDQICLVLAKSKSWALQLLNN